MKRIFKVTVRYDLDKIDGNITSKELEKVIATEEMEEIFSEDEGYEGVEVEVIDTSIIMNDKEPQQIIKDLEEKIKKLEKSNRNWRRKCQRLRNKIKWFSEMINPEEHKRVIVRDKNGKEYRNHEWTGHA